MIQKSEEYKRYYTNSTGVEVTDIDISICVDYREKENVEQLCKVVFSPEQAKLTMLMLQEAIKQFENNKRNIDIKMETIKHSGGDSVNGEQKK